jgi:hypothetical protein
MWLDTFTKEQRPYLIYMARMCMLTLPVSKRRTWSPNWKGRSLYKLRDPMERMGSVQLIKYLTHPRFQHVVFNTAHGSFSIYTDPYMENIRFVEGYTLDTTTQLFTLRDKAYIFGYNTHGKVNMYCTIHSPSMRTPVIYHWILHSEHHPLCTVGNYVDYFITNGRFP